MVNRQGSASSGHKKIIPADLEQAVSADHHFADQRLFSSAQLPDKGTWHDEGESMSTSRSMRLEAEIIVGFVIPDLFEGNGFLKVYTLQGLLSGGWYP